MFCFLKTLILILVFAATSLAGDLKYGPLTVSPEAKDLIVYYESGGEAYYKKNLTKITWPGGASGATGGIGYDFGYNTKEQIAKDWDFLGPKSLALLQSTAGMKGAAGKAAAARIKPFVSISWADANKVFEKNTMPRFSKLTADTFPGINKAHPHVQGAVLSVVFNRGASLSGASRKEMLDIKIHVQNKKYYLIPNAILAMRRLWVGKGLDGLIKRRVAEATLANRAFSK